MSRRKGLGRGLDALLSGGGMLTTPATAAGAQLQQLPVDLIERGRFQPRQHVDEQGIEELAASVRARGVVQPVVVRPCGDGRRFELLAGERRWRAAQKAGLAAVPALVREADDEEAAAVALIENIQREDLNPVEEARALRRLVEEFELTHQQVADAVGRSRAGVSNLMRLLDLEPEVVALLDQRTIEMGHARALRGLAAAGQREAAALVVAGALSVRATEQLVRRLAGGGGKSSGRGDRRASDPDVRRLETELGDRFGAPVKISHDARGRGTLSFRYGSVEELEGILARLRK